MSDTFDRYIAQGRAAIDAHPDFPHGVDVETAASDTIACILHAVYGKRPHAEVMSDAYELLERLAVSTAITKT